MTILGGLMTRLLPPSLPPLSFSAPAPAQPHGLIRQVVRLHIPSDDRAETPGTRTSQESRQAWFLRLWPSRCFWSQKQQKGP